MKLFKFEDYKLQVSDEAYALAPFRKLLDKDKSKTKTHAMEALAYIYFMCDPRSDYQIYVDEVQRHNKVVEGQGLGSDWKPDVDVVEAMGFYKSFKSEAALLLEDTRVAVSKLRNYIKDIDLDAVDERGKPIYTLNTYTATINQIPKLIIALDEAEKAIAREISQSEKVRGSSEKSMFEDFYSDYGNQ